MALYKEHCADCVRELGKDWAVVHRWLDALAFSADGTFRPQHRCARHHTGGVEQVRRMWGDEAAKAAEIHIRKDYAGEVPDPKKAQRWTLCGREGVPEGGGTLLTDE